jgi:hypothetical protein
LSYPWHFYDIILFPQESRHLINNLILTFYPQSLKVMAVIHQNDGDLILFIRLFFKTHQDEKLI